MAQKAKKDQAKANSLALRNLHLGSLLTNALFLLSHFFLRPRSLLLYGLFVLPSLLCQYALERSGRPRYKPGSGQLLSAGEDLAASGLTEYMFDLVWVTWACQLLVILVGDAGWFLWAAIPAYGAYLASRLFLFAKGSFSPSAPEPAPAAPVTRANRRTRRAA